ncbi:hypothetical protein, partial [Vibrio splendidus]|uniref:hypothetical protein n=1 Tax=Vibrio splendidus TaxID=29497 RepID=UPI003D09C0A4
LTSSLKLLLLIEKELIMQNNYVRELAVKTYQEDLQKEYVKSKARPFHAPSFIGCILLSVVLAGLF